MSSSPDAPRTNGSPRGVASYDEARRWLLERSIEDVECITPDIAGVPRGKMMPARKFLEGGTLSLPSSVFLQTISGEFPDDSDTFTYPEADGDLRLVPALATLTSVPWESDPTAQVICDMRTHPSPRTTDRTGETHPGPDGLGEPVPYTPRRVLKHVIALYESRGWTPVVAPEIEFYLVKTNPDPDFPLEPPVGRSGRAVGGNNSYSIAGVNEFDELIDDIYHFSEAQGLEIETLIHEEGVSQLEINLNHGDPLELCDQVFLFKRTIREAALKHGMYATFMAKPIQGQPGSAMHIHHSVVDGAGRNIFSRADGEPADAFRHYIGGMQRHLPGAIAIMAPYVNSYRRLARGSTAPVNTSWGPDNRTTGLRVPRSGPDARRVENRIPSSDTNPYLALAASLACGWLGLVDRIEPTQPTTRAANEGQVDLPRTLLDAVLALEGDARLREVLGEAFVTTYSAVKRSEFETFMEVISPWEREFLLLNV